MIKKLIAIGNSLGIIIDRPILELLEIHKDTPLEVKTDGEVLVIRPVHSAKAATPRRIGDHNYTIQELEKFEVRGKPK